MVPNDERGFACSGNEKKHIRYHIEHPGLHEREIARKMNISLSTLDYHLHYLEKREMIVSRKDGRYTRYFVSFKVGAQDKKIIAILRQKTPRSIVLFLLTNPDKLQKYISGRRSR